jgi:hypothetical protein
MKSASLLPCAALATALLWPGVVSSQTRPDPAESCIGSLLALGPVQSMDFDWPYGRPPAILGFFKQLDNEAERSAQFVGNSGASLYRGPDGGWEELQPDWNPGLVQHRFTLDTEAKAWRVLFGYVKEREAKCWLGTTLAGTRDTDDTSAAIVLPDRETKTAIATFARVVHGDPREHEEVPCGSQKASQRRFEVSACGDPPLEGVVLRGEPYTADVQGTPSPASSFAASTSRVHISAASRFISTSPAPLGTTARGAISHVVTHESG